jgi:hypothetical protein
MLPLLLGSTATLLGCRPTPYAVTTIVKWKTRSDDGRRCYHRCQSGWHHCASGCGGSTSVVIGLGPVAVGGTSGGPACRKHCRVARVECFRGCPDVEEKVLTVRWCPDGDGHCEEHDPASPKLALPLYCRIKGRLVPCPLE